MYWFKFWGPAHGKPATESQIRKMVKLDIPLDAACGCSFEEAVETIETLRHYKQSDARKARHSPGKPSTSSLKESRPQVRKKAVARNRAAYHGRSTVVGSPTASSEIEPKQKGTDSQLIENQKPQGGESIGQKTASPIAPSTSPKDGTYRLPLGFENVRHVRKFFEAGKWVLTTRKGIELGVFDSEAALDEAWGQCQKSRNLEQIPATDRGPSTPSPRTRRLGKKGCSMPVAGFDPKRPWSDQYDMPEYDFE